MVEGFSGFPFVFLGQITTPSEAVKKAGVRFSQTGETFQYPGTACTPKYVPTALWVMTY